MKRPLIVGIAGALVVLAAIVLTFFIDREPDRPVIQGAARDSASPPARESILKGSGLRGSGKSATSGAEGSPASDGADASVSTDAVSPSTKPGSDTAPGGVRPSFDIVRVNPQGDTVIAGRAPPDSEITVKQGDRVIGTVRADKRGEWVQVPAKPLEAGTHELTVTARLADGSVVASEQNVVVLVPERGKDVAGRPVSKPSGALAVAIPGKSGAAPVVLQTPGGVGDTGLSLDAIDYGRRGDDLMLSGRAPAGTEVRVYLDNKFIGRAKADEKGVWRLRPGTDIPTGLYRMRVDRIGPDGKTTARIELPFLRATPVGDLAPGTVAFVQPGNSLWRLARQTYGSGLRYTEIFEANKDQIRDPDLIYPGQVFVLPKVN